MYCTHLLRTTVHLQRLDDRGGALSEVDRSGLWQRGTHDSRESGAAIFSKLRSRSRPLRVASRRVGVSGFDMLNCGRRCVSDSHSRIVPR